MSQLMFSLNDDFARPASDVPTVLAERPLAVGTQESKRAVDSDRYPDFARNRDYGLRQRRTNSATRGVAVFWDRRRLKPVGSAVDQPARLGSGWRLLLSGKGNDLQDRGIVWQDVEVKGKQKRFRIASCHRPPKRDDHLWPRFDAALTAWIKASPVPVWVAMDANQPGGPPSVKAATGLRWYGDGVDGGLTDLPVDRDPLGILRVAHSDHGRAVGVRVAKSFVGDGGRDAVKPPPKPPTTSTPSDSAELLLRHLTLRDTRGGRLFEVVNAVTEPPRVNLTMDGASTLELVCDDHDRILTRSDSLQRRCWAQAAGTRFELVAVAKSGDRVTLTFEDGIVGALRRERSPLSIPAGSSTRADIALRLAREARVPRKVDRRKADKVAAAVTRSARGEEKTDSWDLLGTLASDVQLRRFSDGRQLLFGADDWLLGLLAPVRLREHSGPVVGHIDFDLDVGKPASSATLEVDADQWALPPGAPVRLGDELGAASGRWLVSQVEKRLTSTRAAVTLVRRQHVLKEPEPQTTSGPGDPGDPNFVPVLDGSAGTGTASNTAREAMVRYALAQTGDAYVWGASGPNSFDCSGLVQEATRAAGKTLVKPSASQWATCQAAGKAIPVSQALGIRGALLFRMGSPYNHVAISLGNGSTVDARGSAYPVGTFGGAAGFGWTGAALWL